MVDLARRVGRAVQHHLELAADGDELPAFAGAPQGVGRGENVEPAGKPVALGGFADAGERRLEQLLSGLRAVGGPHRISQVVRADEDGIDTGHRIDLVGDLHRLDVLGLNDDEDLVIRLAVVLGGGGPEIQGVHASADGAVAARWVLGGGDDRPGFGGIHHHGGDDSHRAAVEHHLDQLVPAGGDASQGNTAGIGDGAEHERRGLDVGVSVLHIHREPGKSGAGHEPRRGNAPERQPGADLRLAGLESPFDWILFQVTSSAKSE